MRSILFVDDDLEIVSSTRRFFYTIPHEWQVTFAQSAAEALQSLQEKHYDVIITDIRMPGMSGIDLLNQVRLNHPQTVRIALSGHSDRNASLQASGLAHQYLTKPCPIESIVAAIQQSLSIGNLVIDENVRKLIVQLKTIPSQPQAYLQIVEELKKADSSTGKIGKIISQDASMSAKILQLVNTAFFGLPKTAIDPEQAAVMLGMDTIRDLVLTIGVFSQFDPRKLKQLALSNMWSHSRRTGELAKVIATQMNADKKQTNNAFIAGALHDVGKLILADNLPQLYLGANKRAIMENKEFVHIEQEVFGTTHAQVGSYLFGLWGLSSSIVNAVAFHHEPSGSAVEDLPVLLAVHVANVIDYQLHTDQPKIGIPPPFDTAFLKSCGVENQLNTWQQYTFSQ
ncbi:MAG: response regulator [Anaerolineales bacterium]|nr:response regulator [Anaerolineales bacterium]